MYKFLILILNTVIFKNLACICNNFEEGTINFCHSKLLLKTELDRHSSSDVDRVPHPLDETGTRHKNVITCPSSLLARLLGNGIYLAGKYNYRRPKGVLIC